MYRVLFQIDGLRRRGIPIFSLCSEASAGGVTGTMYNLPKNNKLLKISNDVTVQILVRKFGTNVALELRDKDGKSVTKVC